MAKRKTLPPAKGQRYGWQYVKQAKSRMTNQIAARQFASGSGAEDEVFLTYDPTATTWPGNGWDHRRTTAAGYNRETGILRVEFFTDGSLYDYGTSKPVPQSVAMAFRRSSSPGQFINSTLEAYGYERIR